MTTALKAPAPWQDSTRPPPQEPAPIALRPSLVPRERLVARLLGARDLPLVLIVAPAGYGKSTLLAQWLERDDRAHAWVTLDSDDDDQHNLLLAIAEALRSIVPVSWDVFEGLEHGGSEAGALRRLSRSLGRPARPAVLVIDDLHALRSEESRRTVMAIARAAGPGLQLAIASRADAGLPLGRLRAQGTSLRLGPEDLAMTRSEASMLLRLRGVELPPAQALALARRTEGWAAGLHLAASSLQEQGDQAPAPESFSGEDRFIAEYVREELLSELPPRDLEFLIRTSILERLTPDGCDALLERHDSASRLAGLARSNVLLLPTDRRESSYRYNGLFAQALRGELRRRRPTSVAELHERAGAWCEENGDLDGAIAHAIESEDLESVGRLLWDEALPLAARGQGAVVEEWLARFTEAELAEHPLLALVAAGTSLLAGDLDETQRWAAMAEDTHSDDDRVRAGIALVRAGTAARGMEGMAAAAGEASDLLAPASPWLSLCRLLQGVAAHLAGRLEEGSELLQQGAHRAAAGAPLIQALCLAQLALMEAEAGDLDRASTLADRATAQIRRCGLEDCPTAALPLAVSAELHALRGQASEAATGSQRAGALMAALEDPPAWYEAECRIVLARTLLRLTGPAAAGELLGRARKAAERVPDARILRRWLDQADSELDLAATGSAACQGVLTGAELRVMNFLPSHLRLPEIADRLYVSPNTVKTHVRGIYRKLGVSSRADAVERAREARLI